MARQGWKDRAEKHVLRCLDRYIPPEPNLVRRRVDGGTENEVFETPDEQVNDTDFAGFVANPSEAHKILGGGDLDEKTFLLFYKDPDFLEVDDLIVDGDTVLKVTELDGPNIGPDVIFGRAHCEEVQQ